MSEREEGYYWVLLEGNVVIAEWEPPIDNYPGIWKEIAAIAVYKDSEVKVLSERLKPPR
jgi:hypothetical protein